MLYGSLADIDFPQDVKAVVTDSLQQDHLQWPIGRCDLTSGCFVNVEDGLTRAANAARFEAHNAYIDIQYVVNGESEVMHYTDRSPLMVDEDLLQETDLLFFKEPSEYTAVEIAALQCAVFFPQDAHKPSLHLNGAARQRRKYVYKIPVSMWANNGA